MGLALDKPKENEVPTKIDGLELLVSKMMEGIADGTLVDYINSPYGGSFIIRADYGC